MVSQGMSSRRLDKTGKEDNRIEQVWGITATVDGDDIGRERVSEARVQRTTVRT